MVTIPLDQILLNDANPRGGINPETVDALAASMKTEGQKTEIKVRRLGEADVANLPTNPSLPQGINLYRVIGGDHRVLAARKLGWTTIRAVELKITSDQTFLESYLDNQGQKMSWFSDYLAVEAINTQNQNSKLTQQTIADRVMVTRLRVNQALKLLPLLNSSARKAICKNLTNSGKYKIGEDPAFRLTDLATDSPNDQTVIDAALKVLIDRQMTEPQVQKLVAWVQKGNTPETFPASGKGMVQKGSKKQRFDPQDPLVEHWKALPRSAQIHKTPKGNKLTWNLAEADALNAVKGALAGLEQMRNTDTPSDSAPSIQTSKILPLTGNPLNQSWVETVDKQVSGTEKQKSATQPKTIHSVSAVPQTHSPSPKPAKKGGFIRQAGRTVYNVLQLLAITAILGIIGYVAWDVYVHGVKPLYSLTQLFALIAAIIRG
jgi:hypothetical protein